MSNNPIPGYSIIGRGYNVFGRLLPSINHAEGLKSSCIEIGALNQKTFQHNGTTYSVPENVQADEGDASNIQLDYGKSIEKYLSRVSSDVSISGGYGLFSGELGVAFNKSVSEENNSWYATVKSSVNLFNLSFVNNAPLSSQLKQAFVKLSQEDFSVNPFPFFEFFEIFGTHYIDTLVLGGNVYLDCVNSESTITNDTSITTNLKAAYGALFNIDGKASWSQVNTNVLTNTSLNLRTDGGSIELTGIVSPGDILSQVYNNWHKTLDNHAVPVGATYKEIYELAEDNNLRGKLKVALHSYLSNRLQLIHQLTYGFKNEISIQLNGKLIPQNTQSQVGVQVVAIDRTDNDFPIFLNKVYGLEHSSPSTYWHDIYIDLDKYQVIGNDKYIVIVVTYGSFPLDQVPEGKFIDYLISLGAHISSSLGRSTLGTWLSDAKGSSTNFSVAYGLAGVFNSTEASEFYFDVSGNSEDVTSLNLYIQPNANEITIGKIAFDLVNLGVSNS